MAEKEVVENLGAKDHAMGGGAVASNVAPPKSTGGGGFVFEDDVCAWLLASMLAGEPVFDPELGAPLRVDFQTRPDGWFFDDALVTTAVGALRHRFAISIKSNAQFTASSAPLDFATSAWQQWLHLGSTVFHRAEDFMVLITAPLSAAAAASVSQLAEKARAADPELFPARLAIPKWATNDERSLFASFGCPVSLTSPTPTDADTVRLLQRLRFATRDFSAGMESLKAALALCRRCVRSHSLEDAEALWNLLRSVAAEHRPWAGSVTLRGLVERVRRRILLADYPDHASDWSSLDARSQREATLISDTIGGRLRVCRDSDVDGLANAVATSELVALLGASGSGKSAIVKTYLERRTAGAERTLWVDARSLDCPDFGAFESSLRIRHSLDDLLGTETSRDPVMILDGIDRLYSDQSFRNAGLLVRLARQQLPSTRWRVVVACQTLEWPRVIDAIERASAVGGAWKTHRLAPLKATDLKPVGDAVPALARLLLQPRIASLFTNLKLVDLVVRRADGGVAVDGAGWVGESSVADWFWSAEIDRGAERIARGRFARRLALLQADRLVASVPVDDFNPGDLAPLESLAADQLCVQVPGDRLAFGHDLYGDWARLRILLNEQSDLPAFLRERRESPLWHRALRLFGIHLLEHSGGLEEWRALLASFGEGDLGVVHDVLLEAPVFAVNARPLLDAVLPDLLAKDGVLLRRLLIRFLAFATVPSLDMVAMACAVGLDVNTARATYRRPYWPYWIDVLAFLDAHRDAVLRAAPSEVARIVEMWMSFAPKGAVGREGAAELGILLGHRALSTRRAYSGGNGQETRERFYRCALAAAHERTEDVTTIALTAAGRRRLPPDASGACAEAVTPRRRSPFGRAGIVRGPWPDGPLVAVDEAFQNVVLDGAAGMELYRARPSVAREVVLATLIEPPTEEDWNNDWMRRLEFGIVNRHKWSPPLYTNGPFLLFLRENFTEGLELIARLVDFATERAHERIVREAKEWRARALDEGRAEGEIDQLLDAVAPRPLTLIAGEETLSFEGDERVYGWSAGLGHPPDAVEAALMALEQYFYQRLDDGRDVAAEAAAVLARGRSVALVSVLCDVGKRERRLFEGPLRSLLSAPEIYAWEITKMIKGRMHLLMGAFPKGEWFVKLATKFHELEHRKVDFRNVAVSSMLRTAAMQNYSSAVRKAWQLRATERDPRVAAMVQQLTSAFDPSNYELQEHPEHGHVLVNVEALRVEAARAPEERAMNDRILITTFPMRCRRMLDERKKQSDSQLANLWGEWKRVREVAEHRCRVLGGEERGADESANAILGGAAVFLWHEEWCGADPLRQPEVEAALRAVLAAPPATTEFDTDGNVSTWTWECFAADAVAMLWGRKVDNPEWRRWVAEAVFGQKYAVTAVLFARCAEIRAALGDDFSRLRRLVLEWAHVRGRVDLIRRVAPEELQIGEEALEGIRQQFGAWVGERVAGFVAGTSPLMPADWRACDEGNRFRDLDAARRKWHGETSIDFHVVRRSHEWLPLPNEAHDAAERGDVIRFWRAALGVVTVRPLAAPNRQDHQYPQEDERWVLERAGAAVLQLRADEEPEYIWQTVLDLHSEAHDWPEVFAHALHRHALLAEPTPATYIPLVRLMVHRAFTDVDGKQRWRSHERVWDAVIGVDPYSQYLWEARHTTAVTDLLDVFALWMDRVPLDGPRLGNFANWVRGPAASALRFRALDWILTRVRVGERRELWHIEDAEDAIGRLLNVVWTEEEARLRADGPAFAAFRGLLAWLGDRQNRLGLELLGRLGNLG